MKVLVLTCLIYSVLACPISYGYCQSACDIGIILCYLSTGAVFVNDKIPLCTYIQAKCIIKCNYLI